MPPAPCILCAQPLHITERQTCPPCLARTRSAVMEIVELFALLPAELEGRAGARKPMDPSWVHGTDDPLPGGDVLVLLAHGSTMWRTTEDLDSPIGLLDRYANDWREYLGIAVRYRVQPLTDSTAFLLRALDPMAKTHPAFAEFAKDMFHCRDHLRRATRTDDAVERGVACPYCAPDFPPDKRPRLIRRYASPDPCAHPLGQHRNGGCDQGGRRDDWLCSRRECGRTFDQRAYNLAIYDGYVHLAESVG